MNSSTEHGQGFVRLHDRLANLPATVLVAEMRAHAYNTSSLEAEALLREAALRLAVCRECLSSLGSNPGPLVPTLLLFLDRSGPYAPGRAPGSRAAEAEAVHQAAVRPRS